MYAAVALVDIVQFAVGKQESVALWIFAYASKSLKLRVVAHFLAFGCYNVQTVVCQHPGIVITYVQHMLYQVAVQSLPGMQGGRSHLTAVVAVQSVDGAKQHSAVGLLLNTEYRAGRQPVATGYMSDVISLYLQHESHESK